MKPSIFRRLTAGTGRGIPALEPLFTHYTLREIERRCSAPLRPPPRRPPAAAWHSASSTGGTTRRARRGPPRSLGTAPTAARARAWLRAWLAGRLSRNGCRARRRGVGWAHDGCRTGQDRGTASHPDWRRRSTAG